MGGGLPLPYHGKLQNGGHYNIKDSGGILKSEVLARHCWRNVLVVLEGGTCRGLLCL